MVGTELTNLTNKKAFVHRAFRRASEEPDVQIKREIKKIMADNFKIYLLEGEKIQTENGFRRPDLIDRKRKLVIEIDGSWHDTLRGQKHDEKRNFDYKALGFNCIVLHEGILETFEIHPLQYIAPILYQMKLFDNLEVDF